MHNLKFEKNETSFRQKINFRAELSFAEKRKFSNGLYLTRRDKNFLGVFQSIVQTQNALPTPEPSFSRSPDSLDYREYGYVTEVVDQGKKKIKNLMRCT
jgi:hypothetical protein